MSKNPLEQHAVCDTHGKYPVRSVIDGVVYGHIEGCPTCRREKSAEALLTRTRIPPRYLTSALENYEVRSATQGAVHAACVDYAENFRLYRSQGRGLILCGKPGTGKNHLATGIGRRLHEQRFTVLMAKASEFLDEYWAKSFGERDEWIRGLAAVDLLMIDELGKQSETANAQNALFRVIDARYEALLPTLVTTNLDRAGLVALLGEAAYDRLTQGGTKRYTLDWQSYRSTAMQGVAA